MRNIPLKMKYFMFFLGWQIVVFFFFVMFSFHVRNKSEQTICSVHNLHTDAQVNKRSVNQQYRSFTRAIDRDCPLHPQTWTRLQTGHPRTLISTRVTYEFLQVILQYGVVGTSVEPMNVLYEFKIRKVACN